MISKDAGTRLSTLMEEQGLTVDEFTAAMEAAYQDAVQALVPDLLTQDQADLILENSGGSPFFGRSMPGHGQARPGPGSGMPGPGGSRPGYHGHGSMRGFGGAQPGISGGLAPSDAGI